MLELPESYAIAKQLNKTIKGKRIQSVVANHSPHKFAWYEGDPDDYNDLLSSKCITACVNHTAEWWKYRQRTGRSFSATE